LTATVRIPTPLRSFTGGAGAVELGLAHSGANAGAVLAALIDRHPGLAGRVLDENGELRRFVNLFLGQKNVRSLAGLATPVAPGDVLAILPAVAGGAV